MDLKKYQQHLFSFVIFLITLVGFYQSQKSLIEEQNEEFQRLKFEVEKISNLTSNDKMAEYYKLQQIVADNEKRISALEKDLKQEIKELSEKLDKLILATK